MDWTFANLCLTKNTWQLCAASAIFLASKCEEAANLIPVMSDLRYVCDNAFTDHHLRRMEFAMLQCLQWDLVVKTPVHFLNLFLNAVRRRLTNDHQESHCSSPSMATFMLEDKDEEPHDDDDDDDDSIMSDTPDCTCSGDDCNCLMDRLSVVTDDEEMISAENSQSSMSNRQTFITPSEPPSCNAVQRVAVCLLDLSLYDVSMRANYAPNVIAAAALSIAAQISADSVLSPCDVPSYTSVSESDMLDCRQVLLHLFREA